MAWIKLDDQIMDHPKIAPLSNEAFRWMLKALGYANRFLTNGVLPPVFLALVPVQIKVELVTGRIWIERRGKVAIHDYAEYQFTRDQVESQRFTNRRRQELFRDPILREQVRQRDGDDCRYCGVMVAWTDRRGARGGTYDHVDPNGDNTFENLVVACRGCNARKHNRTPEQAGMILIRLKSDLSPTSKSSATPSRPVPTDREKTPLPPLARGQIKPTREDRHDADRIVRAHQGYCQHKKDPCPNMRSCIARVAQDLANKRRTT